MIHLLELNLDDGADVLALASFIRQPDGMLYCQVQAVAGAPVVIPPHKMASLLRWLADSVEIQGLPETAGPGG